MVKCGASTKRGKDCRQNAIEKSLYCENHQSEESKERMPKSSVKSRKAPNDEDNAVETPDLDNSAN